MYVCVQGMLKSLVQLSDGSMFSVTDCANVCKCVCASVCVCLSGGKMCLS